MAKKVESTEKFKTMIGGQALIEGIMMLGPDKSSVVVRKKDGLRIKTEPRKVSEGFSLKKLPLIRGVFNFCASMKMGVTALLYSADVYAEDDEEAAQEPQSRLDAWLEKHLSSEKAQSVMTTLAVVVGIAFSVALFFVLPSLIGSVINRFLTTNELVRNLLEGLVRIVIFLTYMFLVSRMKDMKRVFAYHGAEHKTIRCYEARLPLTVENVRRQTRLHPRCGTSFLFVVIIISILVFSVATQLLAPVTPEFHNRVLEALFRVALRLLLLPIVVGISYEFNRLVGRHDNWLTRALSAPGMWLQYLTTNEPDDSMIEVGIEALRQVLPEQEGADRW
ncbi:MAG: DUF1385 domain-containing protein [Candidatus Faecousia sp.]|uniref:DUF1385 domain-containing protein n=1 Tax=Faecousia sp. TaxID=2952921 RepID=UPI002A889232|nr:DUF1385 domain-containing protein [Candidatus Faecousia sp.]